MTPEQLDAWRAESRVGLELEWADVDRHQVLPEHLGSWSVQDHTIVNSDGHANCPTGKTWPWGGEVNTVPTPDALGQALKASHLAHLLRPTINYRCNLHVHVKLPAWAIAQAPSELRFVAEWMRAQEAFVYQYVDPIPVPTASEYPDSEHHRGALRRYRRRLVSHQHSLPEARFDELMRAETLLEFKNAHAAPNKAGGRSWHIAPRPGMNLRSLFKNNRGTVEYRHFPGSSDPQEIYDAARWCVLFTEESLLRERSAAAIYRAHGPWTFPTFRAYEHDLEMRYEETKHK